MSGARIWQTLPGTVLAEDIRLQTHDADGYPDIPDTHVSHEHYRDLMKQYSAECLCIMRLRPGWEWKGSLQEVAWNARWAAHNARKYLRAWR